MENLKESKDECPDPPVAATAEFPEPQPSTSGYVPSPQSVSLASGNDSTGTSSSRMSRLEVPTFQPGYRHSSGSSVCSLELHSEEQPLRLPVPQPRAASISPRRRPADFFTAAARPSPPQPLPPNVSASISQQLLVLHRESGKMKAFYDSVVEFDQLLLYSMPDIIERMHTFVETMHSVQNKFPIMTLSAACEPTYPDVRELLGYKVTRIGDCLLGPICELWCHRCNICPHMYDCDCQPSIFKREGWCIHMHAAVQCGRNLFNQSLIVFYHNTTRHMPLAHVRAKTYFKDTQLIGPEHSRRFRFLKRVTKFRYLVRCPGDRGNRKGSRYRVTNNCRSSQFCTRCPQYKQCPRCNICRHNYRCECIDYVLYGLLCEHCHAAAMYKHQKSINKVPDLVSRGWYEDNSEATDEESEEERHRPDAGREERREKRIIKAHHERGMSIPATRIQKLIGKSLQYKVVSSRNKKQYNLVELVDPTCFQHMGDNCTNMCMDCRTCNKRFMCTCSRPERLICKHIHAVSKATDIFWFDRKTDPEKAEKAERVRQPTPT